MSADTGSAMLGTAHAHEADIDENTEFGFSTESVLYN
jgi:hypothetical protein